jgi:hypothetical protein
MFVPVAALLVLVQGCGSDDDTGRMELTWSLEVEATGEPVLCAPGDVVRVTADTMVSTFDCEDGFGVTGSLEEGTWVVTFELVDASGTVLSSTTDTITIVEDVTTDVGHILFLVE